MVSDEMRAPVAAQKSAMAHGYQLMMVWLSWTMIIVPLLCGL